MRALIPAAALACTLALTACSIGEPGGPVTLTRTAVRDGLTVSAYNYAAARGPMLLEVHGSPFEGVPQHVFARDLAMAMPSPPHHQRTRWTTNRAEAGDPDNRFVLLFGAPVAARGAEPCEAPESIPVAYGMPQGTAIQMTFCSAESAMGETRITGPAVTGPDDPVLQEMLWRGLAAIVPPRAREFDDDKRLLDRSCIMPFC